MSLSNEKIEEVSIPGTVVHIIVSDVRGGGNTKPVAAKVMGREVVPMNKDGLSIILIKSNTPFHVRFDSIFSIVVLQKSPVPEQLEKLKIL